MTTPDLFTTAPWRLGKDRSDTCFCMVGYIIYIYIYLSYFICTYMYVVCAYPCIIYIYTYIYLDVCNIYVYMYIHIYTLIRQLALYIMYSMNQSCIYLYTFSVRTCNICVHIYTYIYIYINNIYIRDMFQSTRRFGTDMNNNHRFKHHNVDNNSGSCSQR